MKKKNLKLSLDKMTISRLNSNQASQLNGGADTTVTSTLMMCTPCPVDNTTVSATKLGICPGSPTMNAVCPTFNTACASLQKKCIGGGF
ncbi:MULTISPECIES: class I lanthipeptide [Flavobacterium]|uniref:class I lanthipeptide n=1 Tax=Flavobacterium TaxID=237 RepID=UPI0015ADD49A|nr:MULTISPECIES: class I lanthipeptide [Flavobacterium]MBN9286224.1 class I lanthipeptide [Flavobacterium sp.]